MTPSSDASGGSPGTCARCGAPLPEAALACLDCHHLVHAEALGRLATSAQAAEAKEDWTAALTAWRQTLDLLPPATQQADTIQARIVAISGRLDAGAGPPPSDGKGTPSPPPRSRSLRGIAGAVAAGAAILWKAKFIVVFVLTKAKVLLLGLTKLPTLLSMVVTVGLYTTIFGWKFALGFVISIYIHEMGHVVALARYGIPATAPMFIPGFGALVRLRQYPATPREDATTGLAGPLWGLGAALVAGAIYLATDSPLMAAISRVGAWINLFNLLPVWQLDGGRGWRALDRMQRWTAVGALVVAWAISEDSLLFFLTLLGAGRALMETPPTTGDRRSLWMYCFLVLALAGLLWGLPDVTGV